MMLKSPTKSATLFSSSWSFAMQGNPEGCPCIGVLYRKSVFGDLQCSGLTQSIFLPSCLCPSLQIVSALRVLPGINFAFFILMFICKILPIPAKPVSCSCLGPELRFLEQAQVEKKQGFFFFLKKQIHFNFKGLLMSIS